MAEQYNSNFTGPEIDAILGSAVRYDLAQSLTAAQQKQARENIGADAVQGAVRYDQAQSLSSAQRALALSNIDAISRTAELCTDCNTTVKAGIYRINGSTQNGPSYIIAGLGHLLIVLPWDQNTLVQIYYAPERALKFCRFSASGWKPWECVNPLLNLGGEYRTTERYLGKPVYTMAFSFGALPNASDKVVAMPGTDSTCKIIEIHGYASNEMTLPGVSGTSTGSQVTLTGVGNRAYVITGSDRSSATATIVAKYIKTTD